MYERASSSFAACGRTSTTSKTVTASSQAVMNAEFRWSGSKSFQGTHCTHTLTICLQIQMEFIANSTFEMDESVNQKVIGKRRFAIIEQFRNAIEPFWTYASVYSFPFRISVQCNFDSVSGECVRDAGVFVCTIHFSVRIITCSFHCIGIFQSDALNAIISWALAKKKSKKKRFVNLISTDSRSNRKLFSITWIVTS